MNVFVGIGKISELHFKDKIMKFCFAVQEDKPCKVPCVVFDPSADYIRRLEDYQQRGQLIWLHGRVSSFELELKGYRIARKIEVMTYAKGIQPIG